MVSPSLNLLKGSQKVLDQELEKASAKPKVVKPAPEPTPAEEVKIEVDDLSSEELDSLVEEHGIEVSGEWAQWGAEDKRAWLKANFEDDDAKPEDPAPVADFAAQAEAAAEDAATANVVASTPATEVVPAPKKKGPKKKDAVVSGEILPPDELSDVAHEIENLSEVDARSLVGKLAENTNFTFFKLGGVLSAIQAKGWYEPYGSFREYVEQEHGMEYRRAMYWVRIYNSLIDNKIPWEKVKAVGWTKLKEFADLLTVENVDQWVEIAGKNTTLQLIEIVSSHKKKQKSDAQAQIADESSEPVKTVTTLTLKVHEDQKETIKAAINKAKQESGTEFDTAAMEFIALAYLNDGAAPVSLQERLKSTGLEKALEAFETAFPNVNLTVELPED